MGSMVFRWFWGKTTIGNDGFRWLCTIGLTMEWLCTIVEVYLNPICPCMKKTKKCDKFYPKPFSPVTVVDEDKNRPIYRRRSPGQGGRQKKILRGGKEYLIDNSNIVPYNKFLLLRFASHINVEICTSCGAPCSRPP